MQEVFNLTLNKVGMLLIYIAAGFLLRRSKKLPEETPHVLSLLCTLVFSPAYSIVNLGQSLRMEVIGEKMQLLGYGVIFAAAAVFFGRLLAIPFSRNEVEKSSLRYAFAISNYGYFGYPVIEGVFGQAMLADFMVFVIPIGILTSSYGYMLFQKDSKFSLKRMLCTPMVAGLIIGAAVGLSGIRLPDVVTTSLSGAGACMSPCSMLLAGFMLGKFSFKQLFSGIRPYYLTLIRMLGIPLVFGVVMYLCGIRGQFLFQPLLFASLPLGLNLVVYPESCGYEKEAGENAKLCFISYLMAIIILPCIFALLTSICM